MVDTATFQIRLDSDAGEKSSEEAAELEKLRSRIVGSNDAIRELGNSLRSLRGKSDEVTAAKAQLKAMIEGERDKVSAANVALLKQGTTYEKLASDAKKLAAQREKLKQKQEKTAELNAQKEGLDGVREAIAKTGGPLGGLASGFEQLKGMFGGGVGAAGAFVAAIGIVIGIAVKAAGVIKDLTVAVAEWAIEAAGAARAARIQHEVWTGSTEDAKHLQNQIDLLARKVPLPKEKLNELADSVVKSMQATRVNGQGMIDTINAVATASAAMGDEGGRAIQEFVERAKTMGRFSINPLELQGKGLRFEKVAEGLASNLQIGIEDAKRRLVSGRVSVNDGAKAIRKAVEMQFGDINQRKMLDLGTMWSKLKERAAELVSGVDLDPLLKGFGQLAGLFGKNTASGKGLQTLLTSVSKLLGPVIAKAVPFAERLFLRVELAILDIAVAALRAGKDIKGTFSGSGLEDVITFENAMWAIDTAITGIEVNASILFNTFKALTAATAGEYAMVKGLLGILSKPAAEFEAWVGVGVNIVKSLAEGITKSQGFVYDAMKDMGQGMIKTIKGVLDMHSPSKVGDQIGMNLGGSIAGGLDKSGGDVETSSRDLAQRSATPAPVGGGGARGGTTISVGGVQVAIHVRGGGQDAAQQLQSRSFLDELTRAIEQALLTAGVPTQTPTGP